MKYTIFYKHTCPMLSWAEHDRGRLTGTSTDHQPVFGHHAGKGIDDRIFIAIVEANAPWDAQARVERSACEGWGTLIYAILVGDQRENLHYRSIRDVVDVLEMSVQ